MRGYVGDPSMHMSAHCCHPSFTSCKKPMLQCLLSDKQIWDAAASYLVAVQVVLLQWMHEQAHLQQQHREQLAANPGGQSTQPLLQQRLEVHARPLLSPQSAQLDCTAPVVLHQNCLASSLDSSLSYLPMQLAALMIALMILCNTISNIIERSATRDLKAGEQADLL